MSRLSIIMLSFLVAGCGSREKKYDFKSYPFDQQVIDKLPLYDSIGRVLLQNFAVLQNEMKEHSSFDYSFEGTTGLVNPELPKAMVEKIRSVQAQLGNQFLFEISVYKDSTIRYSVRDSSLKGFDIIARERLSYLPNGGPMQRREAPNKDSILNQNWQYWIRFDEREFFEF